MLAVLVGCDHQPRVSSPASVVLLLMDSSTMGAVKLSTESVMFICVDGDDDGSDDDGDDDDD